MLLDMSHTYNAYVSAENRDEIEKAARAEAAEYFGTAELKLIRADVTSDRNRTGGAAKYEGTLAFELRKSHPLLD
jgi:hypothetical protein